MKITIPRNSHHTAFSRRDAIIYVVIAQFQDGTWDFAYFFGAPFAGRRYLDVVQMKRDIIAKTKVKHWNDGTLKVAKIEL